MTVKELHLDQLEPNDYNPRKSFDTAAMTDLKESIDEVGLVQPLTVRQADENGTYEVVSGERRLRVLGDLHNGEEADTEVPCNVVDVDDREARIIAITENIQREDLNPIEEAKAFGHAVEVDYWNDDDDDDDEDATMPYVEYVDRYRIGERLARTDGIETLAELQESEDADLGDIEVYTNTEHFENETDLGEQFPETDHTITLPTEKISSVKSVASELTIGSSSVAKRLRLLLLPKELQQRVENGSLPTTYAGVIGNSLRHIDDPDRRYETMLTVANDPRADPDSSQSSRDAVREYANKLREDYEQEQEQQEAKVEEWEQTVSERTATLNGAVADAVMVYADETDAQTLRVTVDDSGHEDDLVDLFELIDDDGENDESFEPPVSELPGGIDADEENPDNDVGVAEVVGGVIEALSETIAELGGERTDELDELQDDLEVEQKRLQTNVTTIKEENHSRCPYCKAGINVEDLDDRITEWEERIESLREEKRSVSDARETLRDSRSTIRKVLNNYTKAVDRLERERDRADAIDTAGSEEGDEDSDGR